MKYNISIVCTGNAGLGNFQNRNFALRVGVAYKLTSSLVARAAYGIAYGSLDNIGFGGTIGVNFPFQYTTAFTAPSSVAPLTYPDGTSATLENGLTAFPLSNPSSVNAEGLTLNGRQYDFQTPYVQTMNRAVQYQPTRGDSIQVGYVGTLGRHLSQFSGDNNPTQILVPGTNVQAHLPFPDFAEVPNNGYETTTGTSSYNSLQVVYVRQFDHGLSLIANYTYAKCLSDQNLGYGISTFRAPALPGFGPAGDHQLCQNDATHIIHSAGTYELPFGRGRTFLARGSRLVDALAGGWNVNYITVF